MATHDYNIANQGFPAFRADLNNALSAIVSNNSSATEPATTFAYQWWMDTAADPSVLKVRNADNDAWITLGTFNQTADTFTPAGVTSDKIEEGNSKVEVVDTGTGYIVFEVDGAEVARFNPDQLVTKAGTASTPAVSPTGDLNTGIFFPAADTIGFAEGGAQCGEFDSSANFKFNSGYGSVATAYGCRAWVNFDGTTNVGGNCTIRASGNVSTVADNAAGDYTVNFTTAMPDVNYATTVGFNNEVSNDGANLKFASSTSGSVTVQKFENNASVDCSRVFVAIFR